MPVSAPTGLRWRSSRASRVSVRARLCHSVCAEARPPPAWKAIHSAPYSAATATGAACSIRGRVNQRRRGRRRGGGVVPAAGPGVGMAGSSYRPVSRWRLGCAGPAAGAARAASGGLAPGGAAPRTCRVIWSVAGWLGRDTSGVAAVDQQYCCGEGGGGVGGDDQGRRAGAEVAGDRVLGDHLLGG